MFISIELVKIFSLLVMMVFQVFAYLLSKNKLKLGAADVMVLFIFLFIVLHYILIGKSISINNNLLLLNGMLIIINSFLLRNNIAPSKLIAKFNSTLSVFAIIYIYLSFLLLTYSGQLLSARNYSGFTLNSNTFGGHIAIICMPILLYNAIDSRKQIERYLFAFTLMVATILLVASGSRAAIISSIGILA